MDQEDFILDKRTIIPPTINPKTNDNKIIISIPTPMLRRPDVDSAGLNLRYIKKYKGINAITEQINPQISNNHLVLILC